MSEPRIAYLNSCNFMLLRADAERLEGQIHHDIDNYGMDMSPDIREALQELEKACRIFNKRVGGK